MDLGLAIPGDLEVVGFDDRELAEALDLTTLRQAPGRVRPWRDGTSHPTARPPQDRPRSGAAIAADPLRHQLTLGDGARPSGFLAVIGGAGVAKRKAATMQIEKLEGPMAVHD